ncbi:hypothetical protein mRhiFer1_009280 [Rhinolophus ferrumequinum]|uniref:Uncharacterized protein n=1 Tax=Rhinolophus ferrumequinum TaxID=59479 RepID=A0A7J7RXN4_RHIFE|nr:hypothetical protein mRhiFer1_009280 [Rhinolophus ferrumequinum]
MLRGHSCRGRIPGPAVPFCGRRTCSGGDGVGRSLCLQQGEAPRGFHCKPGWLGLAPMTSALKDVPDTGVGGPDLVTPSTSPGRLFLNTWFKLLCGFCCERIIGEKCAVILWYLGLPCTHL